MAKYFTQPGSSVIGGLDASDNPQHAKINPATNVMPVMDCCENSILNDRHYYVMASTSLDSGNTKNYMIATPNTTTWAHMMFGLDGSAITQFDIYEDSGFGTATDTTLTIFNNNRNSTDASTLTVYEDPTTDATIGTLIFTYRSGSASWSSRQDSGLELARMLILKQNSKYLIQFTSGTNSNLINFEGYWGEFAHLA